MVSEFSHHYAAVIVATPGKKRKRKGGKKSRVCFFSGLGLFFKSILEEKNKLVCIWVPEAWLAIQVLLCLNNK